ncbi:hypothetical protein QOZ80_1AG0016720 [Eleusine coracana subsp. coracana]|nr:hypothetical protein QOZ80_1AG0016720 [Eleusine coracana subsp. coracana]
MACSKTHHASLLLLVVALLQLVVVHLAHCSNEPSSNTSRPGGNTMHVRARWQQQEAAALLQLKQSFSFIGPSFCSNSEASDDTTILLPSWRAGNDCCRWEGISCDRVAVRVTALDLSNQHMQIRGFHPALFNLTSLRYLNLEHNEFCGSHLPDFGFDRLTQLQVLNLRESNLSGTIPLSLSGLHSLKTIYLSDNSLTGLIPDIFSNFPLLEILDLAYNPFEHGTLPLGITHLKNLKVLNLQETNLVGVIPNSIGNLSSLTELHLWGNSFIGGLPWSLNNLTRLTLLNCHDSGLSGRIPSFASLTRLEHMWLSNNKLTGPVPLSNGGSIHPNLKIVDLSKNSFSGSNKFYGPVSISPHKMSHSTTRSYFSSLEIIDLAGNGFTGVLPLELFDSFTSMVRSSNRTVGDGQENNNTWHTEDGGSTYTVPIAGLEYSGSPTQYQVAVDVAMKQQYMRVSKIFSDLVVIDLSNNRFSGSIPRTVGNLTSLLVLNMSHNALTGPIPGELGRLAQIESLDLSWNRLTGEIPRQLAALTALEWLNLSHNDLSGSIPSGSQFSTFTSSSFQGGNPGLYGCPLPVRCNLTQPSPGTKVLPPPSPQQQVPDGASADRRFELIVLWLLVGSGYGMGFALAVVLQVVLTRRRKKILARQSV